MGLGKLLLYTLFMLATPLCTFFATRQGVLDWPLSLVLGEEAVVRNRLVLAAVGGVLAANLVVAGFVVSAWLEPEPEPEKKED